jgi:hypothetical protein
MARDQPSEIDGALARRYCVNIRLCGGAKARWNCPYLLLERYGEMALIGESSGKRDVG